MHKSTPKRMLALLLLSLPGMGGEHWKTDPSSWSGDDARKILTDSPWAKPVAGHDLIVRWESARPVQLALQKLNIRSKAAECNPCYTVAVLGWKRSDPAPEASLKATGQDSLPAFDHIVDGDAILFFFPRAEGLQEPVVFRLPLGFKTAQSIEFRLRAGTQDLKQKFSLPAMSFEGKLAL